MRPAVRGAGLARECVARGYTRLQWWVLDWNAPAIGFYSSLGAIPMDGWTVFRLTGEAGRGVVFSPDDTRLATASDDGTARLWDTTTGQLIWLSANFPNNTAASWSPADNRLLSTTGDTWRYLRAACFDDYGHLHSLQPHERYYTPQRPSTKSGRASTG